jgi:hypothetical protein
VQHTHQLFVLSRRCVGAAATTQTARFAPVFERLQQV